MIFQNSNRQIQFIFGLTKGKITLGNEKKKKSFAERAGGGPRARPGHRGTSKLRLAQRQKRSRSAKNARASERAGGTHPRVRAAASLANSGLRSVKNARASPTKRISKFGHLTT